MKLKKQIASVFLGALLCVGTFGAGFVATVFATSGAAMAQEDDEPRRRSQSLDPAVAKVLSEVFDLQNLDPPQNDAALAKMNELIASRGDRMKAYDKAVSYQMRGSLRVGKEDFRGALSDFQTALNANGFEATQNNQLRYAIAQIQFQLENYQAAIQGLNQWISSARAAGENVDANAYYLLAAAYTQITPPNYRSAIQPAEQAVAARAEAKKSDYDLLNLIYSETSENTKRAALLEKMINLWPHERGYWTQLSGLYSTTQRDQQAFSVLEVAYRAGLLSKESEIITLVNYYSYFDNPYRGAKLLEREMEAGNVARNTKNLTLLSQLWSQSREHKRAIPVLQQAARGADTGELYYRLGQVLLADEQYVASERALVSAINKGGLNAEKTGDIWLLLGTARFSQAGPGDCAKRADARKAFVNAQRYPKSSRQAREWVTYIDAITKTEGDQDRLEAQQNEEARLDQIERLKTAVQVCRLQGGSNCDQLQAQLQGLIDQGPVKPKSSCRGAAPEPAADDAAADAAAADENTEEPAAAEQE
ncbi:MAG: hypothetical protein R3C40_03595 [Parvularculaceae bacterium]